MPSSPSSRIRAELQASGENLNTWGAPKLNEVVKRLRDAKLLARSASGPTFLKKNAPYAELLPPEQPGPPAWPWSEHAHCRYCVHSHWHDRCHCHC